MDFDNPAPRLLSGFYGDADSAEKGIPGRRASFHLTRLLLRWRLGTRDRILIVGTSGGEEIISLAYATKWSFTSVDASEEATKSSQQRIAFAQIENDVTFLCQNMAELSERDFDAATCFLTAHFVPDTGEKLAFFRAIHTCLRPGAPFIVFDLCGGLASEGFAETLDDWAAFMQMQGHKKEVAQAVVDKTMTLPFVSPERQEALLREAGFDNARPVFQALCFHGWIAEAARTEPRYPESSDEIEKELEQDLQRERHRADRFAARLRELGVDPNTL